MVENTIRELALNDGTGWTDGEWAVDFLLTNEKVIRLDFRKL